MDIPKLNMDEEYQKLAYKIDNNSNHHIRKIYDYLYELLKLDLNSFFFLPFLFYFRFFS